VKNKRTILFLGASIVQGRISCSFVNLLKKRLSKNEYCFVNQGVAGYESHNVLSKLGKAIAEKPDFVVMLVGTNDVMSSLDPKLARISRKLKKIPHEATLEFYSENITKIIRKLKTETHPSIALASLPVLGEDLESIENSRIHEYNVELKKISESEHVAYLPVNERQREYVQKEIGGKGRKFANGTALAFKALAMHFLFFQSLDSISKKNGFLLLTDGIHQNTRGATFIADEIESFLGRF
jgi:lysophospholipase L1-like esterase